MLLIPFNIPACLITVGLSVGFMFILFCLFTQCMLITKTEFAKAVIDSIFVVNNTRLLRIKLWVIMDKIIGLVGIAGLYIV